MRCPIYQDECTNPRCHVDPVCLYHNKTCNCEASDARVCWMIRHGEHPDHNPRCGCPCHDRNEAIFKDREKP